MWKTHNLLKKKKQSRKKVKPKSPVVSKSHETPTKQVEQFTGEVELPTVRHTTTNEKNTAEVNVITIIEEVDIISSTPPIEALPEEVDIISSTPTIEGFTENDITSYMYTELGHWTPTSSPEILKGLVQQEGKLSEVISAKDPFQKIQQLYTDYSDLKEDAEQLLSIINNKFTLPDSTKQNLISKVHSATFDVLPDDLPDVVLPLDVYGDGNCFARCLSLAMFGCEDRHRELRVRMALEMARQEHFFMDPTYLNRGMTSEENNIHFILASYLDNPEATKGAIDEQKLQKLYR